MKSLMMAATVLSVGIAASTPVMAKHDVYVSGHYVYAAPGFSISVGVGSPAPYVYGYGGAPVYVAPPPVYLAPAPAYYGLPVVVAPHSCGTRLRAHYVWSDGRYYHHKGHGRHADRGKHKGHGRHHGHGRR